MFLYNTLGRKKQEFVPINPPEVGVYTCGPTVYNYAHIGNLRTYIFEDTLRRTLELLGYQVRHVMNVTDVGHLVSDADEGEDKMEVGARREGKTAHEIAGFYSSAFFGDFSSLNCLCPGVICKATEHIDEMIELIRRLENRGFAYRISDGIYYDTSKFKGYDALTGKSHMNGLKTGARVGINAEKKNPGDFALWKFSPEGKKRQMEWPSPWGKGFPGWHIECSAMSMKYLGETFDIHCGGVDHVAVHHTNEIAQAEGATGKPFVKFWMHGEFLVMGDSASRMAKSSEEFLRLKLLEDKGYSPLDYRYFCLGAHYRTQLEFSWQTLDFARKSLSTLRENVWKLMEAGPKAGPPAARGFDSLPRKQSAGLPLPDKSADGGLPDDIIGFRDKFVDAVSDDLNMPQALSVLWEVVRNPSLDSEGKQAFIKYSDRVLGLDLLEPRKEEKLSEDLMKLVNEREQARQDKDFKKADEIRKQLSERGIILEDTAQGPRWKISDRHHK